MNEKLIVVFRFQVDNNNKTFLDFLSNWFPIWLPFKEPPLSVRMFFDFLLIFLFFLVLPFRFWGSFKCVCSVCKVHSSSQSDIIVLLDAIMLNEGIICKLLWIYPFSFPLNFSSHLLFSTPASSFVSKTPESFTFEYNSQVLYIYIQNIRKVSLQNNAQRRFVILYFERLNTYWIGDCNIEYSTVCSAIRI